MAPESASPKAAGSAQNAVPTGCDVIGFSGASGLLSQVNSDGGVGPILLTSLNTRSPEQPVAAMVFNSAAPHFEDYDLGTPNVAYGGPGIGAGGTVSNNTALGNILVIQNFVDWGLTPNDDDVTGYVNFDFSKVGPITATSLTIIDREGAEFEGGEVKLFDVKGGTELYYTTFPETGSNGVGLVNLNNTPGVGYIEVTIYGSIGLDNLAFCRLQCNYTQGYWKNHADSWPVSSLTIGTVATPYSKADLIKVLNTPVKGNGLLALAHQLIAAKLNVAVDHDPSIATAIAQADALIGNLSLFGGTLTTAQTSALVATLDAYNNSNHCD
ncbi:hypothetical protein [Hymenobacter chitinivorans]|uniref:hypothetical protein n=1 Tax=Hymenobacter chitinivorans TaxID=89969 RepID=UPI0012FD2EB0|nr:hypothetical protein [Hymenobacter chitinivorans]